MAEVRLRSVSGGVSSVPDEALDALRTSMRGQVMTRESPGYDEARALWNAMIDKKPGLIVRCAGTADAVRTVRFAAQQRLAVAVRGAGHNIAGTALCDDGLVIDLSQLRSVHVNPAQRTARVEPGATLADVDHETQLFGLATPVGINSTTGIAGLTLGGGFGWLSRKYGMTVDNLRSADVVMADGTLITTSEISEPDLFWALRGGGGNFGVVTSFEFDLHPVGPQVLSGLIIHPFERAREAMQHYRSFVQNMSEDLNVWLVVRKAPPLPFLPAEWHGREVIIFAAFFAGRMSAGEDELERLRSWGEPIADVIGPHPYTGWQKAFDPLLAPGARNYWKSHNFLGLPDDLIDRVVDYGGRLPSNQTEIFFGRLGGAVKRVAGDATAYPHRDAEFVMNVHARWDDPADDQRCIAWAREYFTATEPHATGGVYVNFIPEDERRVPNAYGANLDRLRRLKKKYDPSNMFRVNQNIAS